jgi:hypothetical protein
MRIALFVLAIALLGAIVQTDQRLAELRDAQLDQAGKVVELRQELQRVERLTHPEVIQERTINYILRQGEFQHGNP